VCGLCRELRLPLTLCTIYNRLLSRPGVPADNLNRLMVFNDVIPPVATSSAFR